MTPAKHTSDSDQDKLAQRHLADLQRRRVYRDKTTRGLHFFQGLFKQQIQKPHKQLQAMIPLWQRLVPGELVGYTRLESFSRGVLRVAVSDSARLYQLDHLLRDGLERQLIRQFTGQAFRRIQLRLAPVDRPPR